LIVAVDDKYQALVAQQMELLLTLSRRLGNRFVINRRPLIWVLISISTMIKKIKCRSTLSRAVVTGLMADESMPWNEVAHLDFLEIESPQRPHFVLTAEIPHRDRSTFVTHRIHIESFDQNRW